MLRWMGVQMRRVQCKNWCVSKVVYTWKFLGCMQGFPTLFSLTLYSIYVHVHRMLDCHCVCGQFWCPCIHLYLIIVGVPTVCVSYMSVFHWIQESTWSNYLLYKIKIFTSCYIISDNETGMAQWENTEQPMQNFAHQLLKRPSVQWRCM